MIEFLGLQTITIGFFVKFYTKMNVLFLFYSSSNSKVSIFGGTGGILGGHSRFFLR